MVWRGAWTGVWHFGRFQLVNVFQKYSSLSNVGFSKPHDTNDTSRVRAYERECGGPQECRKLVGSPPRLTLEEKVQYQMIFAMPGNGAYSIAWLGYSPAGLRFCCPGPPSPRFG